MFATKMGMVKQVPGEEFETNNRMVAATKLQEGDEVLIGEEQPRERREETLTLASQEDEKGEKIRSFLTGLLERLEVERLLLPDVEPEEPLRREIEAAAQAHGAERPCVWGWGT